MSVFWHDVVVNRSVKHKQVVVSVSLPLSTITVTQLVPDRYATSMIQLHAFAICRILGTVRSVWRVRMCSCEGIGHWQSGEKESWQKKICRS